MFEIILLIVASVITFEISIYIPFKELFKRIPPALKALKKVLQSSQISDFSKQRAVSAYSMRICFTSLRLLLYALIMTSPIFCTILFIPGGLTGLIELLMNVTNLAILIIVIIIYAWLRKRIFNV